MFRKVSVLLDCPIVLSEEFVAVDVNDDVCKGPIMVDKDILKFVQSSKNIIDADSEDEFEVNNAAPVLTSSEIRNIMKKTCVIIKPHIPMVKWMKNGQHRTVW
ncbi:hypothetical protein TNCV_2331041 [Trichonephila clavipes]|nr:hypothetical protein TNCV_2331041 [Trichonephila clavipes]